MQTDENGCGYTDVGPGTVIHQSVCLGSHQYMLHYDFVAKDETVKIAYLSQKHFQEAVDKLNDLYLDQMVDFLKLQNGFKHPSMSKPMIKKVVKYSKLMNLPKGWKFSNMERSERLFMILRGSVKFEYGNAIDAIEHAGSKKVNLRNFLAGGYKPVSI